MKLTITLAFILCLACSSTSFAQQFSGVRNVAKDSLIVHRDNGQLMKLTWSFNKKIKKNTEWEELLMGFQTNFQKIYKDVPEYDFYQIKYLDNKQLIIDEVSGTEVYNVEQQDEIEYIKSSTCLISGKSFSLSIGFNDKSELLDPALAEELKAAISEIKHYFYFSTLGQEKHNYGVGLGKMLPRPKPSLSFGTVFGANLGYVKKESYVDLRAGLGVVVDKKVLIALTSDFMFNYNQVSRRTDTDIYVGLLTSERKLGAEYAVKVKGRIAAYDDMVIRAGLNYKFVPGALMGVRYYLRSRQTETVGQNMVWDFRIGYQF